MKQRFSRTVIALATGISLLSATVGGAAAYDLNTYPAPFVTNGIFTGKIVVGENAAVADVLGAIEIAANLQATSTTKTLSNAAYLTGDVKGMYGGKLQLRKKAATTFTPKDLKGLATGHVANSRGSTDFDQYLRFGATGFSPLSVNYLTNDDDELGDFVVLNDDAAFIEWTLQFAQGLESERDSDAHLQDLEDKQIGLVGEPASIVEATIDEDGTDLVLTLMSGSVGGTLREGETATYDIDGTPYEVTLAFVSDPSTSGGTNEAKFLVNGEMTRALEEGESDRVADTRIGVRDILVNSREGVASFYLGAHDVVLTDPTPTSENFDGSVELDDNDISDGDFQAVGYYQGQNDTFRLAWLRYRFTADPASGGTAYLDAEHHTIRDVIDESEGFLSDINIHYHGLLPLTRKDFKIVADGDDAYRLSFVNADGKAYETPLLSNEDGVWKYGDKDHDLIFIEGANAADHNIGMDDYILLSNAKSGNDADKSVTVAMRYTDYDDTNLVVSFENLADRSTTQVPLSSDGIGYLYVGSYFFQINVSSTTANEPTLSMDLDADAGFGDKIKIVTYGGMIVNPAQRVYRNVSTNVTLTDAGISDIVGNGKNISSVTGFSDGSGFVQMSTQVLAKRFDTPATDETFNWTFTQAAGDEIDVAFTANDYDGPINTDTADENYGFIFATDEQDDDHERGMTDYGILIDLYDPSDGPSELTFNVPQTQQYTQLFITIGDVRHDAPLTTSEKVNPIAVGIAITDADAPAIGTANMIVVGGPCVNTVAAELLGNPTVCTEGFTAGEAMIRSFERDGKVALLVAGYDGLATQGVSRALAQYAKYALAGEQVTLVVTDLEHIEVKPTP